MIDQVYHHVKIPITDTVTEANWLMKKHKRILTLSY